MNPCANCSLVLRQHALVELLCSITLTWATSQSPPVLLTVFMGQSLIKSGYLKQLGVIGFKLHVRVVVMTETNASSMLKRLQERTEPVLSCPINCVSSF